MVKVRLAILLILLAGACALAYYSFNMQDIPPALSIALEKLGLVKAKYKKPAHWNEAYKLFKQGEQQYEDRDFEGGIESFKKVLELLPEGEDNLRPSATIYVGQCFYNIKKYEESIEWFDRFLGITDYPFRGYQWMGMAQWEIGNYEKSLKYTQKALDAAPPVDHDRISIGYAYMNMARTLQDLGRYAEALANINTAIELVPKMRWYSRRAQIQYALGNHTEALAAMRELKDKGHKFYKENYKILSKVYVENGLYGEAYDVILEHLWYAPFVVSYFDDRLTVEDRCILAEAAYLSGHRYRAYIEMQSIEKYPAEELAKAGACLVLGLREPRGELPWRGEKYLEPGHPDGVSDQRKLFLRAESRMVKGDYLGAAADFRELLKLKPGDAELSLKLGKVLFMVRRDWKAVEVLKQGVGLAPENAEMRKWLGAAMMEFGDMEEAEVHLAKAAELAPRDPEAHFRLGVVRAQQQEYTTAREAFDRAIELAPWSSIYRMWRGAVLFQLDDPKAAERDMESVLDMGIPGQCVSLTSATPFEMIAGPAGTSGRLPDLFQWEVRRTEDDDNQNWAMALVYSAARDYIDNPRTGAVVNSDNLLFWLEDESSVNRAPLSRWHGAMLFRLNRENEARRWLDDAVKRDPGDPLNYMWRGIFQLYSKWERDIPLAKKDFAAAARKDPRGVLPLYWMGRALLAEKQYAGAAEKFRAALKQGADFPAARAGLILSEYMQKLGRGGYLAIMPENGYCPIPEPGMCRDIPMGHVMNSAAAGWISDNWPDERDDHPLKLFFDGMVKVEAGDYDGSLEKFAHLYAMVHFAGGYTDYIQGLEPDLYAGIIYQAMGREEAAVEMFDKVAAQGEDRYWGASVPFHQHARALKGLILEGRGELKPAAEEYKAAKEIIKDHRWIARRAACVAGEVWDNDLAYYLLDEIAWTMSSDEFTKTSCFMSLKGDSRYKKTIERMDSSAVDDYQCVFTQ